MNVYEAISCEASTSYYDTKDYVSLQSLASNLLSKLDSGEFSTNLAQYIKPTYIIAPVFIDSSLKDDEILSSINKMLFNLYAGFVITAISLDSYVDNVRTVRDIVKKVSTESIKNNIYFDNNIEDIFFNLNKKPKELIKISNEASDISAYSSIENKYLTGRVLKIDLKVSSSNNKTVPIYLYCQFLNRIVSSKYLEKFLSLMNIDTSNRFMMYKAGEIEFWKDFVFEMDLIKKRLELLKSDDDNVFSQMIQNKKSMVKKLINVLIGKNSSVNIHNNIFIIDDNVFKKICLKSNYNYKNISNVQKLMKNIGALFLVRVDLFHQLVTIYIASINYPIELTFQEIKKNIAKGNTFNDMSLIMNLLKKSVI